MRLNRALDRLRRFFAKQGVALSTAVLAALLPLAVLDRMYATYAAMHSFRCSVTSRENPLGTAQDATYEIRCPKNIRFHRVTSLGADMSGQALAVRAC